MHLLIEAHASWLSRWTLSTPFDTNALVRSFYDEYIAIVEDPLHDLLKMYGMRLVGKHTEWAKGVMKTDMPIIWGYETLPFFPTELFDRNPIIDSGMHSDCIKFLKSIKRHDVVGSVHIEI